MIVEDSPTLALTYQAYLEPLGHKVEIAETGKSALKKIADLTPALILLDLKLPDMDGLDILRQLRNQGNKARVIVITATTGEDVRAEREHLLNTRFTEALATARDDRDLAGEWRRQGHHARASPGVWHEGLIANTRCFTDGSE